MALIACPDCGKGISDTAPTCIGCGRVMSASNKSGGEKVTERKGGKYELIGTLLILVSMVGCIGGISVDMKGFIPVGTIGFIIGTIIFLYGRFF